MFSLSDQVSWPARTNGSRLVAGSSESAQSSLIAQLQIENNRLRLENERLRCEAINLRREVVKLVDESLGHQDYDCGCHAAETPSEE